MKDRSVWFRYSYLWVTLGFFLISVAGHWLFGWFTYVGEQQDHQAPIEVSQYAFQMLEGTFENWQSEFLQLMWQIGGLAALLYVGSPQSKEGNDRLEAKVDEILRRIDPKEGEAVITELDDQYAGRHTDPVKPQ